MAMRASGVKEAAEMEKGACGGGHKARSLDLRSSQYSGIAWHGKTGCWANRRTGS